MYWNKCENPRKPHERVYRTSISSNKAHDRDSKRANLGKRQTSVRFLMSMRYCRDSESEALMNILITL